MIQFQKSSFAYQPINFAVVYQSPSSSQVNFVNYLIDIVEENDIDILLDDININAFHDTTAVQINRIRKWQQNF